VVVLNRAEASTVCDYIRAGGRVADFLARFGAAVSPGFNPDWHLERIGCANQTTMLSSESLEIGEMFRTAMEARYGAGALPERFRSFDTICSATQDRQDAVTALLDEQPLDLMIVIGGYNSSNTCNLARICAARLPTYHIAEASRLLGADEILHTPVGTHGEVTTSGWLPPGPVRIGLTSGASTPDNLVGMVIQRLEVLASPAAP
jgi:4-hydroxy-3-methylbut-2-enyl diphosphate reductase